MNNIRCHAILAQRLISAHGLEYMRLISVNSDGLLSVEDYTAETQSTSFAESIALIQAAALDEFLIDDLEMMAGKESRYDHISQYLAASGLLSAPGAPASTTAIISLSRPVDIYILH